MRTVRYSQDSLRDLKRHANVAPRIRRAIGEYAATGAHANNVTALVGVPLSRMRIGDFRVIFNDGPTEIVVVRIGPRGGVYE